MPKEKQKKKKEKKKKEKRESGPPPFFKIKFEIKMRPSVRKYGVEERERSQKQLSQQTSSNFQTLRHAKMFKTCSSKLNPKHSLPP